VPGLSAAWVPLCVGLLGEVCRGAGQEVIILISVRRSRGTLTALAIKTLSPLKVQSMLQNQRADGDDKLTWYITLLRMWWVLLLRFMLARIKLRVRSLHISSGLC
jgi:hypothetical protein